MPPEAKLILPGFALAYAISSVTLLNGPDGLTVTMFAISPIITIGTTSLTGS
ncbi:hypothetical protein D3C83_102930 [compost metagenome]